MVKLSEELWKALQQLKEDEFKKFKWLLKQDDILEDDSGISAAQLEKADRQDTVDLMAQKYGGAGAMKETMKVLEKISRNDLVQSLENNCPEPKGQIPVDCDVLKEDFERKPVQQFAADVTLNPETINPGAVTRKLLENPELFYRCVCWSGQRLSQPERKNPNEF